MTIEEIETLFLAEEKQENKNDFMELQTFQSIMKLHQYMNIIFDRSDPEGNLTKQEGNIVIRMDAKTEYTPMNGAKFLTNPIAVKILAIDAENKIVYVSSRQAREEQRPALLREINERLRNGERVEVMGKLIKLHKRIMRGEERCFGVWVDICGVGIPGFIAIQNWSNHFVTQIDASIGDIIQTTIIRRKPKTANSIVHYECSHKEFTDCFIPMPAGEKIEVLCLECNRSMWIGKSETFPYCYGNYPKSVAVMPGFPYEGNILKRTSIGIKVELLENIITSQFIRK